MRFRPDIRCKIYDPRQGVSSSDYSIVSVDLRRLPSVNAEYITSDVVVPSMIRLHTIAVIPPVITITHLEMPIHIETNIRDTLARGMIAMATPLRPHPQCEIIDGLKPRRRVTVVTTLLHVVSTMTIACKVLPHRRRCQCLVTIELDIKVLRGTLRVGHPLIASPTIDMIGALLIPKIEVRHTQRTAEGPEHLLVLRHLGEMIMIRRLGKLTLYSTSSGIADRLI